MAHMLTTMPAATMTALRQFGRTRPRAAVAVVGGLVVAAAVLITVLHALGDGWHRYDFPEIGCDLLLPDRPATVRARAEEHAAPVYEVKTDALAVFVTGAPSEPGFSEEDMVTGSLLYLATIGGLENLDFQITRRSGQDRRVLQVSGTFVRGAGRTRVPCRLLGLFSGDGQRHSQVFCLFATPQGRADAVKVLTSLRQLE